MPLHPQAKEFLDGLAERNAPVWNELSPAEGREVFSSLGELFGDAPDVERVHQSAPVFTNQIAAFKTKGKTRQILT